MELKYTVTVLSTEAAAAASGSERCPGGRRAQETRKCLVSGVLEVDSGQGREAGQSVSQDMCALQVCDSPTLPFVLDLSHRAHWPSFSLSLWPVTTSSFVLKLSSSRTLVVILEIYGVLSCYIYNIIILWALILLWKCRLSQFIK